MTKEPCRGAHGGGLERLIIVPETPPPIARGGGVAHLSTEGWGSGQELLNNAEERAARRDRSAVAEREHECRRTACTTECKGEQRAHRGRGESIRTSKVGCDCRESTAVDPAVVGGEPRCCTDEQALIIAGSACRVRHQCFNIDRLGGHLAESPTSGC